MITAKEMTDVYAEHNALSRMCAANDVRLIWIDPDDPNQTPRADLVKRDIFLPRLKSDYTPHDRKIHRATCRHENGHLDPSQSEMLGAMESNGVSFSSYLGKVVNAVNDNWQESIQAEKYIGGAKDLDYMASHFCKKGAEQLSSGGRIADEFMAKVMTWHYLCRAEWQPGVGAYVGAWEDVYPLPKEWYDLIPRANAISELPDKAAQAQENIDIARALFELDPEAPDPDQEAPGGSMAGGKGEGDGEEGADWRDFMAHEHGEGGEGEYQPSDPGHVDSCSDPYIPAEGEYFTVKRPDDNPDSGGYGGVDGFGINKIDKVRKDTAHVSGAIRRLFQSESQTKRLFAQKRGRITPKDLARLPTGETRIFNKKISGLKGEADVSLVVDASGSMYHTRYAPAVNAAISLCEALDAANIPVRVSAFTDYNSKVYHYIIKDWKEPATYEVMRDYFSKICLADNSDGDNIMQAGRELIARGNKRKIMIVLSDGQPCSSRGYTGDLNTFTKDAIRHCMAKGIEMYGVGIQTRTVQDYYPKSVVIENPSEIEGALTKLIKETLLEKR